LYGVYALQFQISKSYGVRITIQMLKVVSEVPGTKVKSSTFWHSLKVLAGQASKMLKVVPEVPGTKVKSSTFWRSYRKSYGVRKVEKSWRARQVKLKSWNKLAGQASKKFKVLKQVSFWAVNLKSYGVYAFYKFKVVRCVRILQVQSRTVCTHFSSQVVPACTRFQSCTSVRNSSIVCLRE